MTIEGPVHEDGRRSSKGPRTDVGNSRRCHSERNEESLRCRETSARLLRAAATGTSLPGGPKRRRTTLLAAIVVAFVVAGATSAQESTPAADTLSHAGLVIRHGDGRVTYAYVAFPEAEISGIELLRRSGVEQVTIPFGGLGEGVCAIEGEGCPASECRRRVCQAPGADSPYWRYFGLDETGAWRPFVLGPSSTKIRDGDVHGWSWTDEEPGLPVVDLADVARLAGAPVGGASEPGDDRTAFVGTVYPAGTGPPDEEEDEVEILAYAAAGAIVVAIGGGAAYAMRRGRRRAGTSEEAA